ncbi:MAG TPA: SCP2 sterol-binding domain-containing protein [Anaerolineae bacterium]|nr:SCP2 sterol-binding domain-containing protein [Anaerolineae bacterium]HNU05851.1 SCP2 sterol-binding domain-containing protein [Anaerolineae bacterium]
MAIPFLSDEWAAAFKDALNNSAAYKAAAETWEGDFYFIAELANGEQRTLYLDLWHGDCREAYVVADPASKSPEFEVSGKIPAWKKVIEKKVDPIQGLITRQLKLKGNMAKVLKSVKAAQELVNSATTVPTEFPS